MENYGILALNSGALTEFKHEEMITLNNKVFSEINNISCALNSRYFAIGQNYTAEENYIIFGNLVTGIIDTYKTKNCNVYKVIFHPIKNYIISVFYDGSFTVWKYYPVVELQSIQYYNTPLKNICFTINGEHFITVNTVNNAPAQIIVWNFETLKNIASYTINEFVTHLECTSNNKILCATMNNVYVLNLKCELITIIVDFDWLMHKEKFVLPVLKIVHNTYIDKLNVYKNGEKSIIEDFNENIIFAGLTKYCIYDLKTLKVNYISRTNRILDIVAFPNSQKFIFAIAYKDKIEINDCTFSNVNTLKTIDQNASVLAISNTISSYIQTLYDNNEEILDTYKSFSNELNTYDNYLIDDISNEEHLLLIQKVYHESMRIQKFYELMLEKIKQKNNKQKNMVNIYKNEIKDGIDEIIPKINEWKKSISLIPISQINRETKKILTYYEFDINNALEKIMLKQSLQELIDNESFYHILFDHLGDMLRFIVIKEYCIKIKNDDNFSNNHSLPIVDTSTSISYNNEQYLFLDDRIGFKTIYGKHYLQWNTEQMINWISYHGINDMINCIIGEHFTGAIFRFSFEEIRELFDEYDIRKKYNISDFTMGHFQYVFYIRNIDITKKPIKKIDFTKSFQNILTDYPSIEIYEDTQDTQEEKKEEPKQKEEKTTQIQIIDKNENKYIPL